MKMLAESYIASLIPAFLLLFFAIFLRVYTKSWLNPAAFFSLVWSFFVFIALVNYDFPVYPPAFWYILVAIFCFCVGSLIVTSGHYKIKKQEHFKDKKYNPLTRKIILVLIILSFFSPLTTLWSEGIRFSFNKYTDITYFFSILRYGYDYSPPLISRLFLIAVYTTPILGGFLFLIRKSKLDFFISILSFIPSFLIFLLHTTRSPVFAALFLWLASYFSFSLLFYKREANIFTRKRVLVFLIIFLLSIIFFLLGNFLRWGEKPSLSNMVDDGFSSSLRTDMVGYASAFSIWFDRYEFNTEPTFGEYTFVGVFDFFGLKKRQQGIYDGMEVFGGGFTNVYTIFRGIIQDFTLLGSLIILFIAGAVAGAVYKKSLEDDIRFIGLTIAFYSATLYSFITSIFNYNTIIISLLLAGAYFAFLIKNNLENG